uniref:Uncharacterized protein n=1 Tax=Timema cristinae TaxID=61476 RepID=A0A7R9D3U9_TIMCR|nr:unnamed protein product [Timema cristinae]
MWQKSVESMKISKLRLEILGLSGRKIQNSGEVVVYLEIGKEAYMLQVSEEASEVTANKAIEMWQQYGNLLSPSIGTDNIKVLLPRVKQI